MSDGDHGNIPHPADVALGARIRLLRESAGISQEKLGRASGISYQQILKYEHGETRISYSRLTEIARGLGMSVAAVIAPLDHELSEKTPDFIALLSEPLALAMLQSFCQIEDQRKRRVALDIVKLLLD